MASSPFDLYGPKDIALLEEENADVRARLLAAQEDNDRLRLLLERVTERLAEAIDLFRDLEARIP